MHSLLESFPITKQNPVILQSLMVLQKNNLFIKCLSFQKYREICKQNIFKYIFAINMRLLLLQFIRVTWRLLSSQWQCVHKLIYSNRHLGMTDEEMNLDKNNWCVSMVKI